MSSDDEDFDAEYHHEYEHHGDEDEYKDGDDGQ